MMWCAQHNQYCYEDTCPHGGPRPHDLPQGWRLCEFCGCETNAKLRACCNAGRKDDRDTALRTLARLSDEMGEKL